MKNVIGKIIYLVLFLVCFAALFGMFIKVFHFKYGKSLELYKKLPEDTVDVLVVGSSHAYRNIVPAVMYEQEGYSAYVLGSPAQPAWNTYYVLKEALKTQRPKLIIFEGYKLATQEDHLDDSITMKAISGMSFSKDLIDAVNVSVEDPKRRLNFILGFPWYHSRYKELGLSDFRSNYNNPLYDNYLGSALYNEPEVHDVPQGIGDITEVTPMTDKTITYLDKICDLVRENNCQLLFVITPYYNTAHEKQPYFNWLSQYAKKQNVNYINFFQLGDEVQLNGQTDYAYGNHLSRYGAEKITSYLIQYMKKEYKLDDHRGDANYERWQKNVEYFHQEVQTVPNSENEGGVE